jgi:dienelactone hydrolase
VRPAAVFALVWCAALNAVVADNAYFHVFAAGTVVFGALCLVVCYAGKTARRYSLTLTAIFAIYAPCAVAGMFGVIPCYRAGCIGSLVFAASELIRYLYDPSARRAGRAAAAVFVVVPLLASVVFCAADNAALMHGDAVIEAENGVAVNKRVYTSARGYSVVYYPDGAEGKTPLIAYLHGYYPYNSSDAYEQTATYLASRGYAVIMPNYENVFVRPDHHAEYAARQIKQGIAYLSEQGIEADADRFGMAGHSVGALVSACLCTEYEKYGLPEPDFDVLLDPSDGGVGLITYPDMDRFPARTRLLVLIGEEDKGNAERICAALYGDTAHIPQQRRAFYVISGMDGAADHNWMKDGGPLTYAAAGSILAAAEGRAWDGASDLLPGGAENYGLSDNGGIFAYKIQKSP